LEDDEGKRERENMKMKAMFGMGQKNHVKVE
jgi:hypothetical protein